MRFIGTAPEMEGGCLFKAGCNSYVIFRQLARWRAGWESFLKKSNLH